MTADQSSFTLEPGSLLCERYEVRSPISSGAMGAVYRAVDTHTGKPLAVKHLLDTENIERFEVEARLLSSLRHPRVVEVFGYFHDDLGQYLMMELVEGTDLSVVLQDQGNPGLPVDRAVEYVRQGCEALHYVHEQQIVHRDVKPQNLLLCDRGVVLVDFGIARLLDDPEDGGTTGVGTPKFMAPEVFAGGDVSPRSDVFGIAATLWTLIAGKPPVYASPITLSTLVPETPREIEQAVEAALQMIPERRVASVSAFAAALGEALGESEGESLAQSVDRPGARRNLMEAIVRTAAAVFEAAASSIALTDTTTGELVFRSAWGAGSREIVGVRLPPRTGLAGQVVQDGHPLAVGDCRTDPRFAARIAAGTGYVPYTMLVVPLVRDERPIGTLSLLDRRDGGRYGPADTERAALFAELAVAAIEADSDVLPRLGSRARSSSS